jgi:hypothetical protein
MIVARRSKVILWVESNSFFCKKAKFGEGRFGVSLKSAVVSETKGVLNEKMSIALLL